MQQASFDSWLSYPTRLQLEMVLRTRVHYSPIQYTTKDPPPSSYGRAILGTHAYLDAFSSFGLLVYELYRQPSSPLPRTWLFELIMLTLKGCTSSYMFPPLSVCTRHVLGRLQAKADVGVDHDLTSSIQVPSEWSPAKVSTYGPERCVQGSRDT